MKYFRLVFLVLILTGFSNAFAITYYVKSSGNDNLDGTTDATAWRTLDKVNRFAFKAGDDVYFKAGDSWTGSLIVRWSGTSTDKVVIGSYYLNGGVEAIGVPSGIKKPTINGTYPNLTNDQDPSWSIRKFETTGSIPAGRYDALIEIWADYVTVQNMRLTNSAAIGLKLEKNYHHAIVENSEIIASSNSTMIFKAGTHDNIMRNNRSQFCGLLTRDAPQKGTHPSCNVVTYSYNNIIENNFISEAYGEGIGSWGAGADNNIIKGNILAGIFSVGIYIGNNKNNIVENNIIVGDPSGLYDRDGVNTGYVGPGISLAAEDYQIDEITGFFMRNNFIAGTKACLNTGLFPGVPNTVSIGGKFIGNTCVGNGHGIRNWSSARFHSSGMEIANNIFLDSDTDCDSVASSNLNFHHNNWGDGAISDADCKSNSDVIGNPNLQHSGDFKSFGPYNLPKSTDFEPKPGSVVENKGQPMLSNLINLANYPMYTNLTTSLDTKQLATDVLNKTRNTLAPDIGAIEIGSSSSAPADSIGSSPTPSANVTVPFYMNIGATKTPLFLSNTYLPESFRNITNTKGYCTSIGSSIANTNDDQVYQDYCGSGAGLEWRIPIENGSYNITLLFNEQYWGDEEGTCIGGERRFDIYINDKLDKDEFDICAIAGAANTAVRYTKRSVTVSDNVLSISLSPGSTGLLDTKPEIAGIEIIAAIISNNLPPQPPSGITIEIKADSSF